MSDPIPLFETLVAEDDASVAAVARLRDVARAIAADLPESIRFGTSVDLPGLETYSYLSATIGSTRDARRAGR